MRTILVGLMVIATCAPATLVRAQDCVEGRERVDGLCCWPGQTFSSEAHRCEGAPHCPEGLVEHGEQCVASLVPAAPELSAAPAYEAFAAPPPITGPEPAPRSTSAWPPTHEGTALHHVVRHHGEDGGLVAASLLVFDLGWVMGLIVGAYDASSHSCSSFSSGFFSSGSVSCNSWPFAFIPVGGGMFSGLTSFASTPFSSRTDATLGLALGIPSVILQVAGLIMLAVALSNEVHDLALPELHVDGVSISLVGAAQGADAGASVVLTF